MSVNQLTLDTLEAPFMTKNLFTRHFLLCRLPKHPIWSSSLTDSKKARNEIQELYNEKKKTLSKMTEPQLEHEFVRKILDILGHKDSYTVQTPMLLGFGKFKVPDYVFFKDEDTKKRAYEIRTKDSEKFYSMSSGIGEAKEWGLDLDKKPSTQIMTYLKFGGPRWGILTNGRKWRIYHKEARVDSYYEIDLIDHLENGDDEKFNYFYLFFRRDAFIAEAAKDRCFLDDVLDGSLRFAKELEDDVRENVYKALRLLCKGFLKYPKNNLKPEDLSEIREGCLILLYRLLFILYAEAKKLLPLEDPVDANEYGSISLEALRREVTNNRKDRKILPTLDTHWTHLKRLFEFINEGSEKQGVPKDELFITSYNGGLFDPDKPENRFLEEKRIGNQYLDEALDLLSRSENDEGNLAEVDYDTLSIRHLGSIYEGLLEYKVVPASEDLAEVEGVDTYVSIVKAKQEKKKILATYEKGEPILQTDKGERKATGSYYTPDYIVKYIVKNTVGPLIDEKRKEWETGSQKELLWKKYLELKVLDPAMGSGHFLVEAVNFIGEEVLQAWMQQYEEDENPPLGEGTIEWARHEVVRHCVFGVDLNPLAVELAKLSLWLATVQVNRPLSFLDHHLKCGNSLIGVRLDELAWYPGGKPKKTTIPPAIIEILESAVKKITATSDETLEGVKQQEALFNELKKTSDYIRIKTLADARISLYFGTTIDTPKPKDVYDTFVKTTFEGDENLWEKRVGQNWIKNAKDKAETKHFFHWELEFPEVFFEGGKSKANPGFDVVVGNPPWIMVKGLPDDEKRFYRKNLRSAEGKFDIYVLFIEITLKLLQNRGKLGLIISNKFLRAAYGNSIRLILSSKTTLWEIDDFADAPFFGDAINYPLILLASNEIPIESNKIIVRTTPKDTFRSEVISGIFENEIIFEYMEKLKVSQNELEGKKFWDLTGPLSEKVYQKVLEGSLLLKDMTKWIGQGAWIGLKEVYVGHKFSIKGFVYDIETELLREVVDGAEVERYFLEVDEKKKIIFPYNYKNGKLRVVDIEDYPSAKEYLNSFREELNDRRSWGQTIKESGKKYYEFWNISEIMFRPKILTQDIALFNKFSLDPTGNILPLNTCYVIVPLEKYEPTMKYLLSILNSSLILFIIGIISPALQGGYRRYKTQYLEQLPIRRISFTTPEDRRVKFTLQIQSLYTDYIKSMDITPIIRFVSDRLSTVSEESDVIHDFLAYLAEQMIEMNKLKQETLKKFKIDLEGVLGENVKKLTRLYTPPKEPISSKFKDETKFQEKMKKYEQKKAEAEELLGTGLSQNKLELEDFPILTEDQLKELLKRKLGKIPNLSQVLMIFQKYRDEIEIESDRIAGGKVIGLKALYARIDSPYVGSTDWLIDQIVYKLYGLTDEEIAIVEESFNR